MQIMCADASMGANANLYFLLVGGLNVETSMGIVNFLQTFLSFRMLGTKRKLYFMAFQVYCKFD